MAVYPSIYKAKAVQATDTTITAFVPQVFGDVPVVIDEFLGPAAPGMGWVFFQAGNPEHPVWTTLTAGAGSVGPGAPIKNWSDEVTALQTTDIVLDKRIDTLEATADEVHVGPTAPTDPVQQLWYDTSQSGELKVKTNDIWQTVSTGGGADEVWVNTSAPSAGSTHELWYDPDAASVFPDEVVIGTTQPTDVAANLWVKTSEANALYAKVGGSWVKLTGTVPEEVSVGTVQPTDPAAELWVKTDDANALYAKVSGSWVKITGQPITFPEEVTVGTVQPTDPAAELWIKTDESNALYAKVSGSWVKVSAAATSVPNEVHVSATDPIGTYPELELWVDSDETSPLADDTRWHTAWGNVARIQSTTNVFNIGATETPVNSGTYANFVVGRRYSLMIRQAYAQTVASDSFFIRAYIGGTQVLHVVPEATTTTRVYHVPTIIYVPSTGGSLAVSVTVMRASGTGVANCANYDYIASVIEIIDEGPAIPAGPIPLPTVGLESAKPASPASPMRYFATDTKRDWLYDGTGWIIMGEPLMTYTPWTVNVSLGTGGTCTGQYHRSDGWCDFNLLMTLGGGGTFTDLPVLSLPHAAAITQRYQFNVMLINPLNNTYRGLHEGYSNGVVNLPIYATAGNPTTGLEVAAVVSATYPFTWAVNCKIQVDGRYRLNNRYS